MAASSEFSTLCLKMDSPIVDSPPFDCDGTGKWNFFSTKHEILVHGVGFLGPVEEDAIYEVTVLFRRWDGGKYFDMEEIEKCVSARKGEVFRIMFDQPVKLVQCSDDDWSNDKNYYTIFYFLKGPSTASFQRPTDEESDCFKQVGENEFRFGWKSNQLAEILYSNL